MNFRWASLGVSRTGPPILITKHVLVEKEVPKPVIIERKVPVHVPVEKLVPVPVEKVVNKVIPVHVAHVSL